MLGSDWIPLGRLSAVRRIGVRYVATTVDFWSLSSMCSTRGLPEIERMLCAGSGGSQSLGLRHSFGFAGTDTSAIVEAVRRSLHMRRRGRSMSGGS